jgi:hypothetical protein
VKREEALNHDRPWPVQPVRSHRTSKFMGSLKILDIYMYINNKIYCFIRNMDQNVCYSSQKCQTGAVQVVHLCPYMYLNQRRGRIHLYFKQAIGVGNTQYHSVGQELIRMHQEGKASSSMQCQACHCPLLCCY